MKSHIFTFVGMVEGLGQDSEEVISIDRYIDRYSPEMLRNRSQSCGMLHREAAEPE